jgi:hypothetical protein
MEPAMSNPHTFRPDYLSSQIVESGIALANQFGPERGAGFLSARGVLEPVIARVLSEPEHRRNGGRLRDREERLNEEASRFKFLL